MTDAEKENALLDKLCEKNPTCKECFCNDLCLFLITKTGVATSCEDFRRRVGKVVDREMEKVKDKLSK